MPAAPLVVAGAFGALSPERVAAAIARGLAAGGLRGADVCPLVAPERAGGARDGPLGPAALRELLAQLDFDARMRRARAVVVAQWQLDERTLERSAAFEIATRARQAGVPGYAVTAHNRLDAFDARMLDLQLIVQAQGARQLHAAGRELARVM
jgi:hypothetical protein